MDKPSPQSPAGFYAVDVTQPGSAPVLLTERVLTYSPDWRAAAYVEGGLTVVERVDTGQRWSLDTHGNPPALSPDNLQLIWQESADYGPYEARRTDVWLADLRGAEASEPELALSLYGGSVLAWFPDSQRWLISASPALTVEERVLSVFSLADGSTIELARAERISRVEISSGGTWVAYFVSFAPDSPQNGVWIARSDGAPLRNGVLRHKLDWFGAYQWRDDERLLVVPMELGAASHVVWQVEAGSGDAVRLTDPGLLPFKIAGGDWRVSPDGRQIVFVNAGDHALWLLTL
ncbi:MAG: hypothetical protein JW850_22620 [Thermoflexales bacterium]|nr:hypothetical protein [Thermoflexales bacterium]